MRRSSRLANKAPISSENVENADEKKEKMTSSSTSKEKRPQSSRLRTTVEEELAPIFDKITLSEQPEPVPPVPAPAQGPATATEMKTQPKARMGRPRTRSASIAPTSEVETIRKEIQKSDCNEIYKELFPDALQKQVPPNPIAVIIAGTPGAGKSTVYKSILPPKFLKEALYLNVDNYAEYFQAKYNLFSNPSASRPVSTLDPTAIRSLSATALAKGTTCADEDLRAWISEKKTLIIDKPCDRETPLRTLLQQLSQHGYDVYMLMIHVSEETALNRNNPYRKQRMQGTQRPASTSRTNMHMGRERQLPDRVISDVWNRIQENLSKKLYETLFKEHPDRFIMVDNEQPSTLSAPSSGILEAKAKFLKAFQYPYFARSSPSQGEKVRLRKGTKSAPTQPLLVSSQISKSKLKSASPKLNATVGGKITKRKKKNT